jgi:uncharacterized protein
MERHSLAGTIAAHLLPGGLALLFYLPATGVVARAGWPAPFALFLTMLVVLVPCELAVLLRARNEASCAGAPAAVPNVRRPALLEYLLLVPPMLGWAFFCFFVLAPYEERLVSSHVSPWIRTWLAGASPSPAPSKGAWVATMIFGLLVNGLAVPVVEELYFRGYLLPRIPLSRAWAPLANAALFSLYHLFSPWQNLSRTLAVVPIAYAVSWKRSVFVGIATHCLLNTIAMSLALVSLLR